MNDSKVLILKVAKERRGYRVFANTGDYLFSEDSVIKYNIFKNNSFSQAEFAAIVAGENKQILFNKALRFLSYQERSCFELESHLSALDASAEEIADILEKLKALGYINDERYTDNMLQYAFLSKKGPGYIHNRLTQKGIASELISAFEVKYPEEKQKEIIEEIIRDYVRKNVGLPPRKLRIRLYQKLMQSGFSADIVIGCLDNTRLPAASREALRKDLRKLLIKWPADDPKSKYKIIQSLLGKGYTYDEIAEEFRENE